MLVFPRMLLREREDAWNLVGHTTSPGASAAGVFPIYRTDGGGAWACSYDAFVIDTPQRVRLWRAVAAACDGGATPIVVPMCDRRQAPWSGSWTRAPIPHSDGTLFSDGTGYGQPFINARAAAGAALRSTSLTIRFATGGPLEGGEHFSVNHPRVGWRLYRIIGVARDDSGDSVATIRPPLREAVAAGDDVEFDMPRCVMRLAAPNAMDLKLDLRRFGSPDAAFIETFM